MLGKQFVAFLKNNSEVMASLVDLIGKQKEA